MKLLVFILAVTLFSDCSCFIFHQVKHSHLIRVRRDEVKILETSRLKDGTKLERIQESGNALPPLPIEEEEIQILRDSRIGSIDKDGQVFVPVDENHRVVDDYAFLLKPIIVTVNNPSEGGDDISTNYDDLDDEKEDAEAASRPAEPQPDQLPPVGKDYADSGEVDEDVTSPENVEAASPDVQESVIYPNKNEVGDKIPLNADPVKEQEEGKEIEIERNIEQPAAEDAFEKDLTSDEIESIANDFGKDVFNGIMSKAKEFGWGEDTQTIEKTEPTSIQSASTNQDQQPVPQIPEVAEVPKVPVKPPASVDVADTPKPIYIPSIPLVNPENAEGVILEVPDLEEDQKEQELWKEKNRNPSSPSKPIVRGGRVGGATGNKPDHASTYQNTWMLLILPIIILFL